MKQSFINACARVRNMTDEERSQASCVIMDDVALEEAIQNNSGLADFAYDEMLRRALSLHFQENGHPA